MRGKRSSTCHRRAGRSGWLFSGAEYSFAEPLRIFRRLWLEGPSGGMNTRRPSSRLPTGRTVWCSTPTGRPATTRGGSKAIKLWLSSRGKSGDVGHGVVLKAPVHLESMFIGDFRGDGVNIHTGPGTNANGFYVERVQVAQCGGSLDVTQLRFWRIKGTLGEFHLRTGGSHHLRAGDNFWLYSPHWVDATFPYDPDRLPDPKVFHCGTYRVEEVLSATEITAVFAEEP